MTTSSLRLRSWQAYRRRLNKNAAKEIIEVKPGMLGINVNSKEITKRIWKWILGKRGAATF
jgi:hypothetical protein